MRGLALCLLALGVGLAVVGACSNQPLPGTFLGRYTVTGTLTSNTCGAGLAPPNPWTFPIELSRDGGSLYWSFLDGTPAVRGDLDAAGATTLKAGQAQSQSPSQAGAEATCSLERDDTLKVLFGTAAKPASFSGSFDYAFHAADGTDCGGQLTAAGGTYDVLPCGVDYTFTAAAK